MLEDGLVALIIADADISALIATRLYPVQGPPDNPTYPYVTYQAITGSSDYAFEGAECRTQTIQFDFWGNRYDQGSALEKAFRNLLSGYVGTLPDGTRILFAKRGNFLSNFDNDSKSYRSPCEYEFEFSESE